MLLGIIKKSDYLLDVFNNEFPTTETLPNKYSQRHGNLKNLANIWINILETQLYIFWFRTVFIFVLRLTFLQGNNSLSL